MGRTNIRSGRAILQKAAWPGEDIAWIPDLQKSLIINSNNFSMDDIHGFANLLRYGRSGVWNKNGPSHNEYEKVEADQSSQIPMLHVSKALVPEREMESSTFSAELIYITVIEGCNGHVRSKLVDRTDLDRVGADLLWECANGYSLVFSGAMLKSNWLNRSTWPGDVRFEQVNDKNALVTTTGGDQRVIHIWC